MQFRIAIHAGESVPSEPESFLPCRMAPRRAWPIPPPSPAGLPGTRPICRHRDTRRPSYSFDGAIGPAAPPGRRDTTGGQVELLVEGARVEVNDVAILLIHLHQHRSADSHVVRQGLQFHRVADLPVPMLEMIGHRVRSRMTPCWSRLRAANVTVAESTLTLSGLPDSVLCRWSYRVAPRLAAVLTRFPPSSASSCRSPNAAAFLSTYLGDRL